MKTLKSLMMMAAVAAGTALASSAPAPQTDDSIAAKAVHEIRMYPRFTIWDNVTLHVNEGQVELNGQVSQAFKKQDLERIVARVPGVTGVANRLEVLPVSPFDDSLRIRVARAVYGNSMLSRYSMQALPPIHIIVKNGEVRLEGVVRTEAEKTIAGMAAGTAGMSFGAVVNNLRVENPKSKG